MQFLSVFIDLRMEVQKHFFVLMFHDHFFLQFRIVDIFSLLFVKKVLSSSPYKPFNWLDKVVCRSLALMF